MSSLSGEPQLELVPKTIALILVFLPFVLAARSYSREVVSGTLQSLLVAPIGGWGQIVVAKIVVIIWLVSILFLCLLFAIQPLFGFSPKPGLVSEIFVQALAAFVSTCLGLFTAIVARHQSQVYIFVALYFLALVLLSGFLFPLESAAPIIRMGSYASPLTFSDKILNMWLFFGVGPLTDGPDIIYLIGQCVFVTALLTIGVRFARGRI